MLALALLGVNAAAARAGFAPANESIASGEQLFSSIATDAQGDSIVVWNQEAVLGAAPELKARRLAADGTLGPVFDLAPGEIGSRPVVAMTPDGRAIVAWESVPKDGDPAGVKARWVEPSGALGPLLTLIVGKAALVETGDLHTAIDPAGVATVTWENSPTDELGLRRIQPDSAVGALVLDAAPGKSVLNHEIAVLPNGSTVLVWRGNGVEENVVTGALTVGVPTVLSSSNAASDPQLAVDAAGNGLAVWRETGGEYSVRGRRLGPAGGPVGEETIITPDQGKSTSGRVEVSADSSGDFLVSWNRQNAAGKAIVYARGLNSAGAFAGPEQPLSEDGLDARTNEAALLDSGDGAALWEYEENSARTTFGRTVNALAQPTGPIESLFGDGVGEIVASSAPAVGFAAFAIRYALSGSAQGVVVRRFLVPPICANSTVTVGSGEGVEVPLACTGLAIESAAVAAEPTHGTIGAFNPAAASFRYRPKPGDGGNDSFSFSLANDGGSSALATVTIVDRIKPTIKSLRFAKKKKKRGKGKPALALRLSYSEPSRAVVKIERAVVRKGKRRFRTIGKVASKRASRRARIAVRRKLAKKLAAGGKFRATAVAIDTAGNRSKVKRARFAVR